MTIRQRSPTRRRLLAQRWSEPRFGPGLAQPVPQSDLAQVGKPLHRVAGAQ